MVSTEGGLAILGLNEDSLVACANRLPYLEGTQPATSAAEAATLLDARGIGIRPAMFEQAPVQTRRSSRDRQREHAAQPFDEFPRRWGSRILTLRPHRYVRYAQQ